MGGEDFEEGKNKASVFHSNCVSLQWRIQRGGGSVGAPPLPIGISIFFSKSPFPYQMLIVDCDK